MQVTAPSLLKHSGTDRAFRLLFRGDVALIEIGHEKKRHNLTDICVEMRLLTVHK